MKKITLSIDGMTCSACSSGLEKYLQKQKGIEDAIVNLVMATTTITYDESLSIEDLNRFVKEAGFISLGEYNPAIELNKNKQNKLYLIIYTILAIILMYISMGHMIHLPSIPLFDMHKHPVNYTLILFTITCFFLYYGRDILKNGYKNLIHKTPNMDTLVSIGVLSSLIYSLFNAYLVIKGQHEYVSFLYFESSSIVIYFIKIGRFIDSKSKDKTKEAIQRLVTITPDNATLKTDKGEKVVTLDEIKENDILIVKPGEKIAVDGIVIKGESHLDESFITGESNPVKKKKNDKVIAGSINYDGYLEYKATNIGKNSTISSIVKMVVEASNTKAPISRVADKVSSIFVPTIILISIISLIVSLIITRDFNSSINTFISVLVVACPCALGLATPLAIIVSEGLCISNGILVKSSSILELSSKVDTIVFDKTGTLTYGNLKVSNIYNYSSYSENELLNIVCSLEKSSSHPISIAFNNLAKDKKLNLYKVTKFQNIAGYGLNGIINKNDYYVGNSKLLKKLDIKNIYQKDEKELSNQACSIVYVIENKKIIGLIGIKDIVREEAYQTIKSLQGMKKEVIMLTGDNEITANIIAESLGIKNVIANVIPIEKGNAIKKLTQDGKIVMMVGDGINDAPSLTISNIGVSIGSGTDIANDSSDVILLTDNMLLIKDLIYISHKTINNIKQNLFWAFFYNICMIPIAIGVLKPFGIVLNPMLGSLAMTISSLTIVFNALRLKYIKLERKK